MAVSEKFEWICNYYKRMSGNEYLGFSNATFLSGMFANFNLTIKLTKH